MMCLILLAMTAYFTAVSGCDGVKLCSDSYLTAGAYSCTKVQYTRPIDIPFMVNFTKYGCCWNCTFEMVGYPGSRYCFKKGPLVTVPGLLPQDKCFKLDKYYQGIPLGQDPNPTNAFECGRACNVTAGCNYWTFTNEIGLGGPTITHINPEVGQFWTACYLFNTGTTYDRKDAISGVKGCPP